MWNFSVFLALLGQLCMYELTKEQRLCKNREYQLVYRRGKSYVNRRVVLYVLPRSPKQPTRIGFVTGKKSVVPLSATAAAA